MRFALALFAPALLAFAAVPSPAPAADPPVTAPSAEVPDAAAIQAARQRGIDFLRTTQNDDGGWSSRESLGISAIVTVSLLDSGLSADSPAVAKALDFLAANVRDDGGIYSEGSTHRNYETALSLMALSQVKGDKYADAIQGARGFLKELQWDTGEGIESDDVRWGGAGYGGGGERPDLSNTQFLVEALKASGSGPDDEAIQKALVFVTRTQNLEGHGNDTPNASKINDGGFYYTPALGGQTKAGTTANGGLRSYASMTYAGLKSMIYAGLTPNDPRVKAARDWAAKHYTLTENPGMGLQGHYYYLQTLGKTLNTLGGDTLTDADGVEHNWRDDLAAQLLAMQRENGSWVNDADRWYEGDPNMVTAYALMALADAAPPKTGEGE